MVYVVERYLPGLSRANLLPGLSKLESAIEELHAETPALHYLGSTIVLGDEACFCQFEAPSAAVVAEANRKAGLPFDRIVPAVLVNSTHRRGDMSVSTSEPKAARVARSHRLLIVSLLAVVIAVAAWAVASYALGSSGRPASNAAATQRSVLFVLTPSERKYVLGIGSLTAAQLQAAFGTDQPADGSSAVSSLTPAERHYVQEITAMSRAQQAAAFGTGK